MHEDGISTWPHAPTHRLIERGVFIVTAGTYLKQHFFAGRRRLDLLTRSLRENAEKFGWELHAWAAFSNHYHFVAVAPEDPTTLRKFLSRLHATTAIAVNGLDGTAGRKVWHNFWETALTYERSYLARLNYVHQNPVRHGLVVKASEYPFCSAGAFEVRAPAALVSTVYSMPIDRISERDEFDPVPNDD